MTARSTTFNITYTYSGEEIEASLSDLRDALIGFLDHLAVKPLIESSFYEIVQTGHGLDKYQRLLAACDYEDDEEKFYTELLANLGEANGTTKIEVGGVEMPHLLLMAILEVVLSGDRLISVKSTEQLEKLTNTLFAESQHRDIQKIIETYPVRLSMHTIRQMRISGKVAYQYLPFVEELDSVGHTNTWVGQFNQGLLEQMYQNRVIFLLNMDCPVYCRFCFRKHKESRNQKNPSLEDVREAIKHVENSPTVKEILITGGDPFMNRENLSCAIDGLMNIEHVQTLRLATRSIAYYPNLFLANDGRMLRYLKRKNLELQDRSKRLEIATHFIHPDEISPQCLKIITDLVKNGIAVYVQTPFLKDCNDQGPELVRLFSLLRGVGAELHSIYMPCSPIHGNSVFWAPISTGLEIGNYLRAHLSDRAAARICTATPIGKMDWHSSGWAVEPVEENNDYIWIRSPYTPDYFKEFAPDANKLTNIRVNEEGTIDVKFMAKIGDESLYLGARPRRPDNLRQQQSISSLLPLIRETEKTAPSLIDTGSLKISRVHETRVEVDADCEEHELQYICRDERITDVVIFADRDGVDALLQLSRVIRVLEGVPHVNAVRLRSLKFNYEPQSFTPTVIDRLASMNKLTLVGSQRLEIETQFLVPEEFTRDHRRLTRLLNNVGITVYNNTPLLGRINDNPETIHLVAYMCREAGIEFHHLYVAGLDLQNKWNKENPVALYDVIDIATRVHREGSGREIPHYIIRTLLGEVDFGLSSRVVGEGEDLLVKLLPYNLDYYKAISADFSWPEGVIEDIDGRPIVPMTGLSKTTGFALS